MAKIETIEERNAYIKGYNSFLTEQKSGKKVSCPYEKGSKEAFQYNRGYLAAMESDD